MEYKSRFSEATRVDLLEKSKNCIWMKEGLPGLQYLTEARGLSEEIIRSFHLGFIPHNVRNQLAGRIIIPIYDASGNLVVLTSRLIKPYESKLPVYWHEKYKKNSYLFGLDHAKRYMREWEFATICEGQFDVLQAHNHGITNTVGLCCTMLSDIQLSLIHRYCDEIVLILDADENEAGQNATEKIMKTTLRRAQLKPDSIGDWTQSFHSHYKIAPIALPRGMDPDAYLRQNGDKELKSKIKAKIMKLRENQYVDQY